MLGCGLDKLGCGLDKLGCDVDKLGSVIARIKTGCDIANQGGPS